MIKLNRKRTQNYLQQFDFESLFIEELGWDTVDPLTLQLEVSEKIFAVEAIAHKRGFTVYQCISEAIPERKIRLQLDGQLTEFSKSHLLIFGDGLQTEQLWMWVKQEQGKKKPVFHLYQVGKGAESLIQKIEALFFDIAEEDETTLVRAVEKVSKGFNVEQVT